jgi:hypothetical protein
MVKKIQQDRLKQKFIKISTKEGGSRKKNESFNFDKFYLF